jgi:hypothetical protein
MYSVIGGILIFISSIYIGMSISNIYKHRCELLQELPIFINFCDGEIAFYKLTIEEIFEKYQLLHPDSLLMLCINHPKENINYKNVITLLNGLTDGLKTLDRQSHKAFFETQRNNISVEIDKAVKDANIRGNMAKRLTPLIGLCILILLI